MFQYGLSETIPICFIRLSANIVNVLHSKVATKFKLKINVLVMVVCMIAINFEKIA